MIRKPIVKTATTLLMSFALMPGVVSAEVPNVFAPGTAISSTMMNDNFDNLDERVTAIEEGEGGADLIEVDCADDAEALQDAIDEAEPGTDIEFRGTCGPIEIDTAGLTIEGKGPDPLITNTGEIDAVISIEGALNLTLIDFEVEANGTAEFGIVVEDGAFVTIEAVKVANATDAQVFVTTSSTLKIDGDNELGVDGNEVGLLVSGNSFALSDEANDIVAETSIECEFGSTFVQESADGLLNVDGDVDLVENCAAFFTNAVIAGVLAAQQSSVITLEPEDGTDVTVEDGVYLSTGSHLLVGGDGTVEIAGDEIFLLNSTATFELGTLSAGSIQAHSSSRIELHDGSVVSGGTDVLQLHSFSVLHSSQVDDVVTTDQVVCFGMVSGAAGAADLCL